MKDTLRRFTTEPLFDATSALLTQLHIQFDRETAEPIDVADLYDGPMPQYLIDALQGIAHTYFVGIVNDESLRGAKAAESLSAVATTMQQGGKYDGMFVFACDAKSGAQLTRTQASALTRAFNRIASANPVILVIRQGEEMSLSTCERTNYVQEWRQGAGEKVGKVTLLRGIDCMRPHRGHLDILASLGDKRYATFDELYRHWLEVFSSELLTKKFYNELSDWYAWAVQVARFPNDLRTTDDDAKFNHESCIRLITRLIFVWFLKQKGLIPEQFFDEAYIREHFIDEFNPHDRKTQLYDAEQSKYYRLILQNLFFAMLNCPIVAEGKDTPNNRRFRKTVTGYRMNSDYNVNNLMRYEGDFKEGGAKEFIKLANTNVPFLNGGLFDCLDDKPSLKYYDGFSERRESLEQLYLPDYLFFGEEVGKGIDLSQWYDDIKKKSVSPRGLIDILKRYSFTIEENTPLDQEVSLDPELLGKVFENLLAAYNPETKQNARKQTGSFYTPREIVQYMVDESVVAHLKRMCGDENEQKYRDLVSYASDEVALTQEERSSIMQAIYHCRVLDPACGSGAFPMGVLQQMVHVLKRIDPTNEMWKELVLDEAVKATELAFKENLERNRLELTPERRAENDQRLRERTADIEEAFNSQVNDPDYARKLYLIEHCIYGVDIQPIATQISKLRFFISLVVDQKPRFNDARHNFGIRPLPNLESKFVTANTLIPLSRTRNLYTSSDEVRNYEEQLHELNHRLFLARKNKDKQELRQRMTETRANMAQVMENEGFISSEGYDQLFGWNMFDQNASAPFFDPEWMFGVKDGFDIVIANPPYVNVKRGIDEDLKRKYESIFKTAVGQYDLFLFFIELGLRLSPINCMIVPKPILNNEHYEVARSLMLENGIEQIITGSNIFEKAGVESCIFLTNRNHKTTDVRISKFENSTFEHTNTFDSEFYKQSSALVISTEIGMGEIDLMSKLNSFDKFESLFNVKRGVEAGKKDDSIIDYDNGYPLLRGQDVSKYNICYSGLFIEYDPYNTSKFKEQILYTEPKILLRRVGNKIQCAFDNDSYVVLNTIYCLKLKQCSTVDKLRAYTGVLNSKLVAFWFFKTFCNTDKLFPYIRVSQLEQIPIPKIDNTFIKKLGNLVICIHEDTPNDALDEIDHLVYHLYNLTYDEVLIIDPDTPITREQYESFKA